MLLAGCAIIGVGVAAISSGVVALAVAAALFFGIKVFAVSRRAAILRQAGEGYCADCGAQMADGGCPECR